MTFQPEIPSGYRRLMKGESVNVRDLMWSQCKKKFIETMMFSFQIPEDLDLLFITTVKHQRTISED